MRIDGEAGALRAEMTKRLSVAIALRDDGDLQGARAEASAVLAAGDRVAADPGELLVCCESIEDFFYCSLLYRDHKFAAPPGTTTMMWHPVPLAAAHVLLGVLDIDERRPEEARGHLRRALELHPAHVGALHELSYLSQQLGDPGAALRYAREAYRHSRQDADVSRALRAGGAACIDLGTEDLADCFYRESQELQPDMPLSESQLRYIRGSSTEGLDNLVLSPPERQKILALLGFVRHEPNRILDAAAPAAPR